MPTTYEAVATFTVPTGQTEVLFTAIPQTYTDLFIVVQSTQSGQDGLDMRVGNGSIDTGNNYVWINISSGTSGTIGTAKLNNYPAMEIGLNGSTQNSILVNLMNYSNTTTYKSYFSRGGNVGWAGGRIQAHTGNWRNTAAINQINFRSGGGGNLLAGNTFTIYGIKAA
jgi:hypothetical protein